MANSSSPFLIARSPASGLLSGGSSYQLSTPTLPPTAPKRTASDAFAVASASSVRGTPYASIEQPPISTSLYVNLCPYFSATLSRTFLASRTISGPIPSPGISVTLNSITYLQITAALMYPAVYFAFLIMVHQVIFIFKLRL